MTSKGTKKKKKIHRRKPLKLKIGDKVRIRKGCLRGAVGEVIGIDHPFAKNGKLGRTIYIIHLKEMEPYPYRANSQYLEKA